jgi:hypothetical protein
MTDTTVNAGDKVERKAKHELIAKAGGEHCSIDMAVGIRYTDLSGTTQPFEYIIPEAKAGTPLAMLALFGAKTKATNETSRVRNGKNGGVSNPIEEMEALDEVFESITNGVWRDKAEGGGGSRTDKELLATVVLELLGATAKGDQAHYVKRFTDDLTYLRKVLASDAGDEYRKRAGKVKVAIADLA